MKKTLMILTMASFAFTACKKDDKKNEQTEPMPSPEAAFTIADGQYGEKDTIRFTNESKNADSYIWDFGDGHTSAEESPTHVYYTKGTYTVTLTAQKGDKAHDAVKEVVVQGMLFQSFDVRQELGIESMKRFIWSPFVPTYYIHDAGENQVWDFEIDENYFEDASITFCNGNELSDTSVLVNQSDIVVKGPQSEACDFYTLNSSSLNIVGIGSRYNPDQGYSIVEKDFNQPLTSLQFPVSYGQEVASSSTYSYEYIDSEDGTYFYKLKYDGEISLQLDVDGSGTLITPSGNYECLRVKETVTESYDRYLDVGDGWEPYGSMPSETQVFYKYYCKQTGWFVGMVQMRGSEAGTISKVWLKD